MLVGDTHRRCNHHPHHPILSYPPKPAATTPTTPTTTYSAVLSSLRRQLLSSTPADNFSGDHDHFLAKNSDTNSNTNSNSNSDEEFYMYEFKIRMCTRPAGHDWTECPFAHAGEKSRRRDPRKVSYSGHSCSEYRKGSCKNGDICDMAHGVFESWLHPSKFRTHVCKDGSGCSRRVCFYAHSPSQLRSVSLSGSGLNPNPEFSEVVGDLVSALRELRLQKVNSVPGSWGVRVGSGVYGSPPPTGVKLGRTGFISLPATAARNGGGWLLEKREEEEGEVVMERVESGRAVRARMFEKLSEENSFSGCGSDLSEVSVVGPDLGWISDLIT